MKGLGRRLIGIGRFWIALIILGFAFYFYPKVLTGGFDINLELIRWMAAVSPEPYGDYGEAFLRFINAEKLFLVGEISFFLWFIFWMVSKTIER